MADDRGTSQGVIAPVHAIGHSSPPPPSSPSATSIAPHSKQQQQKHELSPPRGPRTLLLRRSENGFGFTLRHFIVYPPESCCMLPGHERTKIDEPMDTIFVKQVRANSPASEAGLRTGDRVVSVDGVPTRGEQYASVVQRIQQAGAWLRLLVVSKEDDILQRYFGDTAHNPETNQRPARLKSPERLSQKQRRSMSMIPGSSASRTRQSWLCQTPITSTPPGSENQGTTGQQTQQQLQHRLRDEILLKDQSVNKMATSAPNVQRRPLIDTRNHESIYGRIENDRTQRRSLPQQKEIIDANITQYHHRSPDNTPRYDLYDRTRPESIYSRPSSEQIYDRIKDPIYERVRPDLNTFSKSLDQQYLPMSRAEPQVPIYRPGRRVVTRRASEGSGPMSDIDINDTYSSNDLIKIDSGSRTSVKSRRDSSPISKESSLSSYDSNSTLTGNECSDDSVIMTRLRKSFEQKEEFLRRPSHPIGWLLPDDANTRLNQTQGVIQREFYARPQKLQRQVWPPSEQQQPQQISSQPNSLERVKNCKPSNQCIQRVRDETTGVGSDASNCTREGHNGEKNLIEDTQALRDKFYSSIYNTNGQFVKENHFNYCPASTTITTATSNKITNDMQKNSTSPRNLNNNKNAFVTTLSRIHENVSSSGQQQHQPQYQDIEQEKNGSSSLPSSPGSDKKLDKFPVPPQGLQIVSRRAKQFESGKLLSDDDEPTSDRTNLYKSELSRLSNKRSVPNVAVRKREFESKAESQDTRRINTNRESKSLDSGKGLSGNRIIPVGSKYIHCIPPSDYKTDDKDPPAMDMEPVRLRTRSNSAESWEAANGGNTNGSNSGSGTTRRGVRHTWQTEPDDEEGETRNTKAQRQDSYLQAVRSQLARELPMQQRERELVEDDDMEKRILSIMSQNGPIMSSTVPDIISRISNDVNNHQMPTVTVSPPPQAPIRPNKLSIPHPLRPHHDNYHDDVFNNSINSNQQQLSPNQHHVDEHRDPSTLVPAANATNTNTTTITVITTAIVTTTTTNTTTTSTTTTAAVTSSTAPITTNTNGVVLRRQKNTQITDEERATRRVSYLKATWGERMHVDSDLELSDSEPVVQPIRGNIIASTHGGATSNAATTTKDIEPVERESSVHVKFTVLDGKRSTDRSWKQVWGVLRGPILYFYKDRHSQSPSAVSDGDAGQNVDVRCSLVDIADDYTKRKHVLRVANPTAEVLLQTEDAASMALWLRALHKHAAVEKPLDVNSSTLKQQAVPQTPGPTTPISSISINSNGNNPGGVGSSSGGGGGGGGGGGSGQRLSPLPSHKGIRKLTSFRNRSPTGQSPVNKTRKPSQTVEQLPSPKSKTWKGRVAKQLRRMHGQAGSPSSPTAQLPPEGATFKVPLELCPVSSFSEFVPLIVEMCTSIVEARGLEVIGIYRVPGNTAAISQLTESVNKGFENINLQDPRWSDVNVISSLLKSFFRQLPDSLLTADLYPMFIDADKIEDPQRRMATIRKLLRDLPEHHFETLKYLMFHLKRVVDHSEVNKMEAKNLAIVFGPTLVRASGSRDNMVTMVTDMSHQCRIVESLLNNVDWFFCEEDLDDLSRLSVNLSLPADGSEVEASNTNHNLLLNNIQKVEGMREMVSAKDIVSSIISAANRKIQRRRKGQEEQESEDHEEDKNKAKQDESLGVIRQSMALNERQCSVSEMVMMHENKNQPNTYDRSVNTATIITTNTNDSGNSNPLNNSTTSNRSKYSNTSLQGQQQINTSSLSYESPRIDISTNSLDTVSTISNTSNDTKQSNDEVTIRTYAGLSATTQERIRRFEQETKAMLQRDQHRQRREAEKREEERRRIEMEWQLAKRDMENDDSLDGIIDTTVGTQYIVDRLPNLNERIGERPNNSDGNNSERHRSKSTTRLTPLSIAVQQQPTARQKAQATNQLTSIIGEKINNGIIKKFKTEKDPSMESLVPTRYGSLDSLHEVHTSSSPSYQTRGIPGDISDDGSDLLTSLTSTFDRKWKSLVNPSSIIVTSAETYINGTNTNNDNVNDINGGNIECGQLTTAIVSTSATVGTTTAAAMTTARQSEVYRDPSLHKSLIDKNHVTRTKNDALDDKLGITEKSSELTPDNDRNIHRNIVEINTLATDSSDGGSLLDATEKDESPKCGIITKSKRLVVIVNKNRDDELSSSTSNDEDNAKSNLNDTDERKSIHDSLSYSNKLEKFESLSQSNESRSRLKRSESLNKRTEMSSSKLKRSESLNKHSDRLASPTNGKLKRSESLNKHAERSESPNMKLKRSESLTKTEKTECNISKRRQSVRKESATKLKRKNGMPERSIKRRHTVGGTKDFDKVHWLDNKLQSETERIIINDNTKPKKSQLRTSSPDLSSNRVNVADTSFLIEVSFRGPSNVVFNVTNTRPQSLPDANLASKVFKVPLESHV